MRLQMRREAAVDGVSNSPRYEIRRSARSRERRWSVWDGAAGVLLAATVVLTIAAAGDGVLPGDIAVATRIQRLTFPASGFVAGFGYWIGTVPVVIALAAIVLGTLLAFRRFAATFLMLAVIVVRALNPWLKAVIDSPRPRPDQVPVAEMAGGLGFPSGHVMGTVLLAGALVYLATLLQFPALLRVATQVLAVVAVVSTSYNRIDAGAHWPSDVLGGLLWGTTLLLVLIHSHSTALTKLRDWRTRRAAHQD